MNDQLLRVPEAARRLNLSGVEVYGLIERGELNAGRGDDGLIYVPASAVDEYRGMASAGTTPS